VLTVGLAWFTDMILDNFVATRMLAKTLKVHPAAVMVMAIIGANLIGVVGMVLASPVTASLKLFWHYIMRKMFDLNPWDGLEAEEQPAPPPRWYVSLTKGIAWLRDQLIARGLPNIKQHLKK
jgi:predicted PurR-regulated permease PerM